MYFLVASGAFLGDTMKVIKSINNNVSLCLDSRGREVIVFGKGIGFYRPDEDIPLYKINRTFYNIKDTDYGILRSIPTVIINTSIEIVDYVSDKLNIVFPSSTAISLADHLQFAIQRKEQSIYLPQPIMQDIYQLYPQEMEAAFEALRIIERMTGVKLPRQEASTIALHFITDRINPSNKKILDTYEITEKCTLIIEDNFHIQIDRESFNYSRFAVHLDYLLRRLSGRNQIESENQSLFEEMKKNYPDSYRCALLIGDYLNTQIKQKITDEEILYLVIHINRLLARI